MNAAYKKTMTDYLKHFSDGNLAGVLSLFNGNAVVISPTAGAKAPVDFYPVLLERSKGTTFTLKLAFAGETPETAASRLSTASIFSSSTRMEKFRR